MNINPQGYHCMYENHEREEILGYCLNPTCKKSPQFCFKCLAKFHHEHSDDQYISEQIQSQTKINQQFHECLEKVKQIFDFNFKKIEVNIKQLENIFFVIKACSSGLQKEKIEFLKEIHHKEMNEKQRQFLSELNTICLAQKDPEREEHQDALLNTQYKKGQVKSKKDMIEAEDYANTGKLLLEEKQYKEALWFFEESLIRNDQQADVMNMKGLTLDNLERYQESLKCYNLAIRANPNLIQAYHNKGNTLYNLENFKDAVECYHQVIQLCPKKRDTYNNLDKCYSNLGNTLSKLKKYSDAIIAFDTAYELNQDPFYLRNKGDTLLILGRKAEAKQCYQDAIQQGYQNVQYVREKLRVLQ